MCVLMVTLVAQVVEAMDAVHFLTLTAAVMVSTVARVATPVILLLVSVLNRPWTVTRQPEIAQMEPLPRLSILLN